MKPKKESLINSEIFKESLDCCEWFPFQLVKVCIACENVIHPCCRDLLCIAINLVMCITENKKVTSIKCRPGKNIVLSSG